MTPEAPCRLAPNTRLKEERLALLLRERGGFSGGVSQAIEDALVEGSLELSGTTTPEAAARLRSAMHLDVEEPFSVNALAAWHQAATGAGGFRGEPKEREKGPPSSPPELIPGRLKVLEEWVLSDGGRQLSPVQTGALILARVVEILPFDSGNGRVARLAASHAMMKGGLRPPLLSGVDKERLEACLDAAFQLHTEPLVMLLEEASLRALDVGIRVLSQG